MEELRLVRLRMCLAEAGQDPDAACFMMDGQAGIRVFDVDPSVPQVNDSAVVERAFHLVDQT